MIPKSASCKLFALTVIIFCASNALSFTLACMLSCRAWRVAMSSPVTPATFATWTLFMLEWVATFIQKCPALKSNSITVLAAAEVFKGHMRLMLPAGEERLSQMLEHLSGAACAAQLHVAQFHYCPAGRGKDSLLPLGQQSACSNMHCDSYNLLLVCCALTVDRCCRCYSDSCLHMQGLLLPSLTCWLSAQAQTSKTHSADQCLMLGGQHSTTQPQADGNS